MLLVAGLTVATAACSDDSLAGLGGRSSEWIGEVATTASTTTTTAPVRTRSAQDAEWINDEFGAPDPDLSGGRVLAAVFARSGDSSQFLQASRQEIVAVVPDIRFPSVLPVEARYVTSQLVIESRELTLADDPTVAFGLWSVEPYSRSRSVGQLAVLNASRDTDGVARAEEGDPEELCTALISGERTCGLEELGSGRVWRLEDEGGVVHVWFADPFRYELEGMRGVGEELVHQVISSAVALEELLPPG
ncbi:MAG: hypothetical protein ACLFWM_14635 [Actinomycetota bacterium]